VTDDVLGCQKWCPTVSPIGNDSAVDRFPSSSPASGAVRRRRHIAELKGKDMGLLTMVGRTAAVAGTATVVSNRVSRRQANRWRQKADQSQAEEQQQSEAEEPAPPPQDAVPPAPQAAAPAADASVGDEIQQLATIKEQGVLGDDEFTAAKAKLLGI